MFEVQPGLAGDGCRCGDSKALITEVARLAVSGRAGTDVVQATSGDLADLRRRWATRDHGRGEYLPAAQQGERWTTLEHLDTRGDTSSRRLSVKVPQLVTEARGQGLGCRDGPERGAGRGGGDDADRGQCRDPGAGCPGRSSGKSHTMAVFAPVCGRRRGRGRRVIGLTTSH